MGEAVLYITVLSIVMPLAPILKTLHVNVKYVVVMLCHVALHKYKTIRVKTQSDATS
jgi:antibiotic biosynthesis monooxygenase (ABM) superfamily enzyme